MPVWQQFHEVNRDRNVEVFTAAIDVQGPDKVKPYVEKAKAKFTTVVDETNLLGTLYGFKSIPNGYLIDESGVVRYKKVGGFDIRSHKTAEILDTWSTGPSDSEFMAEPLQDFVVAHSEANTLFKQGLELYRDGKVAKALRIWRASLKLEPENFIIRKQVWAVQNPEKFYDGNVDYDWQRKQIRDGM